MRQQAGLARPDVPVELGQDALGQVVGLDQVVDDQLLELGREPEVAANHAPDQALVCDPVEALVLHVALAGREHEGQVAWFTGLQEALFDRGEQLIRSAAACVSGGGDGVAAVNDGRGVGRLDDLFQAHLDPPRLVLTTVNTRPLWR